MVMLVCIVLSMGLPSTALYIVVAVDCVADPDRAPACCRWRRIRVLRSGAALTSRRRWRWPATPPPASPAPIRCKVGRVRWAAGFYHPVHSGLQPDAVDAG
ncbi:hypothetical protein J4732_18855, partial [Serratia marcescens]|nr:hypothetical protein [Serratia marcescens]